MSNFPTPRVVISQCIEFEPVRWNGQIISNDFVDKLKKYVEFIPVCPEVQIGLTVPRATLRLVDVEGKVRLLESVTGKDFTDKMNTFASNFFAGLNDIDGFILMGRSPSSGIRGVKIYPSIGKVAAIRKGKGIFGKKVLQNYGHLAVEEEGRLKNSRIREHFLRKLFTLAYFRKVSKSNSISDLLEFHTNNKLMLKAYNQSELRKMGRILANKDRKSLDILKNEYESHLHVSLRKAPSCGSYINVLESSMGYFKDKITKEEKNFFLSFVEKYREAKAPLVVPYDILRSWIVRFNDEYLAKQTFFEPYPDGLIDIDSIIESCDSRDYWKE